MFNNPKRFLGKVNTDGYRDCKTLLGAHTTRVHLNPPQGGKKPVKKTTTKKSTTKKPVVKKPMKKTTTKKPVVKKPTKKTTTKKPVVKKSTKKIKK